MLYSLVLKCVNPLAHEGQEFGSCEAGILFIMVVAIWVVIALLIITMVSCCCWAQVRNKYKGVSRTVLFIKVNSHNYTSVQFPIYCSDYNSC